MAVIITDMEMPKSCMACKLTYIDTGDDAYFGRNEHRCVFDGSCIEGERTERQYDCPLKEVPDTYKLDGAYDDGFKHVYLQATADAESVLEDIKAEIGKLYVNIVNDDLELGNNRAVYKAIKIIDNHISGKEQ